MSAGATHLVALASAARGIGAMANRLPSASVPATKLEQLSCRMRRFCHAGDDMRRLSTVRTYNGLLPSKFSNGPKGASGGRHKLTHKLIRVGAIARTFTEI